MNLDYVDVFYIHRWDPDTPIEETMEALVDIVRQGKALYVGISRFPHDATFKALAYLESQNVHCLLFQDRYNILDRTMEEDHLFPLLKEHGVGVAVFSPLHQGLLTQRYLNGIPADSRMARRESLTPEMLTEDMLKALRGLNEIAQKRGQTLAQMSLSWLLDDDRVRTVIIGASSREQLKEDLRALENTSFTFEERDKIEHLSRPVQFRERK